MPSVMSNSIRSSKVSSKTLKKGPRNGGIPQGDNSSYESSVPAPVVETEPASTAVEISVVSAPVETVQVEPVAETASEPTVEAPVPEVVEVQTPVVATVEKPAATSTSSTSTLPKKKR